LKGGGNRLQLLLQKPYRTLRGQFKTVAEAHVDLDLVLQLPLRDSSVALYETRDGGGPPPSTGKGSAPSSTVSIELSTNPNSGGGGGGVASSGSSAAVGVHPGAYEEGPHGGVDTTTVDEGHIAARISTNVSSLSAVGVHSLESELLSHNVVFSAGTSDVDSGDISSDSSLDGERMAENAGVSSPSSSNTTPKAGLLQQFKDSGKQFLERIRNRRNTNGAGARVRFIVEEPDTLSMSSDTSSEEDRHHGSDHSDDGDAMSHRSHQISRNPKSTRSGDQQRDDHKYDSESPSGEDVDSDDPTESGDTHLDDADGLNGARRGRWGRSNEDEKQNAENSAKELAHLRSNPLFTTDAGLNEQVQEVFRAWSNTIRPEDDTDCPTVLLVDFRSFKAARLYRWLSKDGQLGSDLAALPCIVCSGRRQTSLVVEALTDGFRKRFFKRGVGVSTSSSTTVVGTTVIDTSGATAGGSRKVMRVVLAGDDALVSQFLEAYVASKSKERRSVDFLKVYPLPLGERKSRNSMARWIASHDVHYRSCFFSSEWKSAFHPCAEDWFGAKGEFVVQSINRYLDDAKCVFSAPIGEVMLERRQRSEDTPKKNKNKDKSKSKSKDKKAGDGQDEGVKEKRKKSVGADDVPGGLSASGSDEADTSSSGHRRHPMERPSLLRHETSAVVSIPFVSSVALSRPEESSVGAMSETPSGGGAAASLNEAPPTPKHIKVKRRLRKFFNKGKSDLSLDYWTTGSDTKHRVKDVFRVLAVQRFIPGTRVLVQNDGGDSSSTALKKGKSKKLFAAPSQQQPSSSHQGPVPDVEASTSPGGTSWARAHREASAASQQESGEAPTSLVSIASNEGAGTDKGGASGAVESKGKSARLAIPQPKGALPSKRRKSGDSFSPIGSPNDARRWNEEDEMKSAAVPSEVHSIPDFMTEAVLRFLTVKEEEEASKEKGAMPPIARSIIVSKVLWSSGKSHRLFDVVIDGVVWTQAAFVSVSPLWAAANVKSLPIAVFNPSLEEAETM